MRRDGAAAPSAPLISLALAPPLPEIPDDPTAVWTTGGPSRSLTRGRNGWQSTMRNLTRALATPGWWRRLAYDVFRDAVMWCDWRAGESGGAWVAWTDEDYADARIALETAGFDSPGKEIVRDAVWRVATWTTFDSAQTWLAAVEQTWDGVPRVEAFLHRWCGAEDSAYTRAVGAYLWSALAGRVLVPGIKADLVPMLYGRGGVRKTSLVRALAPSREFSGSARLDMTDADIGRVLRGKLVVELPEMRGLHTRSSQEVKDFLSMDSDEWTPKYKELAVKHPRRFVFIGTTDQRHVLADDIGNLRRWLPVEVHGVVETADPDTGAVATAIDLDGVGAVLEQLWAEGAALFRAGGVRWQDAERLAKAEHDDFSAEDVIDDDLLDWINELVSEEDGEPLVGKADGEDLPAVGESGGGADSQAAGRQYVTRGERGFTLREALVDALGVTPRDVRKYEKMVSRQLEKMGFVRKGRGSRKNGERTRRLWKRKDAE